MAAALHTSLAQLFGELIDGPAAAEAYMLNGGDPGLLRSLERLPADQASYVPAPRGASIAAHVDHVCYGLDLMNRWSAGEANPWADADWTASWKQTRVTDDGWNVLRERLRASARRWHASLAQPRDLAPMELNGVIASLAHLAYHFGAIRQIDRSIQGPKAEPRA